MLPEYFRANKVLVQHLFFMYSIRIMDKTPVLTLRNWTQFASKCCQYLNIWPFSAKIGENMAIRGSSRGGAITGYMLNIKDGTFPHLPIL